MILVGIDIGKNSHYFAAVCKEDGEVIREPAKISNNLKGFEQLVSCIRKHRKQNILIGMEDTGHYHFPLLKFLLDKEYTVALINPVTTDLTRKANGSISKTDRLDTLTICDVLSSNKKDKKPYRIFQVNRFDLYEQRCLTRHHHNLKEELNVYLNRLQKCIDIVFPEYNSLFNSKYGIVYMNVLKTYGSAESIAKTDIRSLRKCFEFKGKGMRISLTAEELKEAARNSIGISSVSETIQIRHLISQIELINEQLEEVDKKIEEFSRQNNSPILSIPGISHFSGTSILSELGEINNFTDHRQIIKYAGVAPLTHESSQFKAQHTKITKKGSRYLRKTLYQIILPVINSNKVFKDYYNLKISQGKSHRCAQGHCVRKLLRVIFHLLKTGQNFDPALLT
ncbi:MAG: IS110 family transposase [Solobacterium sp.]|nr:IS110 family transposase [Solobacterium sp.]